MTLDDIEAKEYVKVIVNNQHSSNNHSDHTIAIDVNNRYTY